MESFLYKLPEPIDPDGGNVTIALSDETPQWIKIQSNSELAINMRNNQIQEGINSITIKLNLIDASDTKIEYSMFIEFVSERSFSFSQIQNIESKISTPAAISVIQNMKSIIGINLNSKDIINWICYSRTNSLIYIYDSRQ